MICPARKTDTTNYRSETADIRIQEEANPSLPDLPDSRVYRFPYVIDASEFQKVKRISSVAKIIKVVVQGDNYLGFICDKEIYSTALHFGERTPPRSDDLLSWEGGVADAEMQEDSESSEENAQLLYQGDFNSSLFNHLVKLPGLCNQMQFYAPTEDLFPLRIRMEAGLLGTIEVYIKDIKTLAYDQELINPCQSLK